jgi:hypothetical protein
MISLYGRETQKKLACHGVATHIARSQINEWSWSSYIFLPYGRRGGVTARMGIEFPPAPLHTVTNGATDGIG